MDRPKRQPPRDPKNEYLFRDIVILSYIERSVLGGPPIEYFEKDVKWYYKTKKQIDINKDYITSKLQRFWAEWHGPGYKPDAWRNIYVLGLKGLPRLPQEQKESVMQQAEEWKDGTAGTPRRARSDSVVPRALLGAAKRSSKTPLADSGGGRVKKRQKYDESPTRSKGKRIAGQAITRRTPNSRTPVRALSKRFQELCKSPARIKKELISTQSPSPSPSSSPSPSAQLREHTEQTGGSHTKSQLDELSGQNAQLKIDLEVLRSQKAHDTQYWERQYRDTLKQRDYFKRQYKDIKSNHNRSSEEVEINNRSLCAENKTLQDKLDSYRDVLQFEKLGLQDHRGRNVRNAIEYVDQVFFKLNNVLQGQDSLFAIERLDAVSSSSISALFERALGIRTSAGPSGRRIIHTTSICMIELRSIVIALLSAALCNWVFEADVGPLFQENDLAYSHLQRLLVAWDKTLTRSFELAAHKKCIDDPFVTDVAIPTRAKHLARQTQESIMPLLEAHKGLSEEYVDIADEWAEAGQQLAEIFEQALYAKVTLLLSTDKYRCAHYMSGVPFDRGVMENNTKGTGDSIIKPKELVKVTIFPAILRYTSEDDFSYNRFISSEKPPPKVQPEVLRRAQVLTR